jgi:hypothetical protein
MNSKMFLIITALALAVAFPSITEGKDKKKPAARGMIESMQSLPCGVKERGVSGVGSVFASVGVTHVNSNEKLCQQYLFRTDDMEYHIRALDTKHPPLLPLGHEAEFSIKKDRLFLRVADGDKKTRPYQVISMEQLGSAGKVENTQYRPQAAPPEYRPPESRSAERQAPPVSDQQTAAPPPQ